MEKEGHPKINMLVLSEHSWAKLNYPLIARVSNKEADLLNEKNPHKFFKTVLTRLFLEAIISKNHSDSIWVVLHFDDDTRGNIRRLYAVMTHNFDMGLYCSGEDEIPASLDWSYHGAPCEQMSINNYGDGYPAIDYEAVWSIVDEIGFERMPYPSREIRRKLIDSKGLIKH